MKNDTDTLVRSDGGDGKECPLHGVLDAHVHLGPDLVPRAQSAWDFTRDAAAVGMAGAVGKDHCAPTVAVAAALNAANPDGQRFVGSITLNPSGGLNPCALLPEVGEILRASRRTTPCSPPAPTSTPAPSRKHGNRNP